MGCFKEGDVLKCGVKTIVNDYFSELQLSIEDLSVVPEGLVLSNVDLNVGQLRSMSVKSQTFKINGLFYKSKTGSLV